MKKAQKNLGIFYSDAEFKNNNEYLEEYILNFLNSTINLYRVDVLSTSKPNLYGEIVAEEKSFHQKVQIPCRYNIIESGEDDENLGLYTESLSIEIHVLQSTLKDLNVEINYGDFLSLYDGSDSKDRFFEITNKDKITSATRITKNFRPFFKTFTGTLVNEDTIKLPLF